MYLFVYDQDSLPRAIKPQKKNSQFHFLGTVSGPTYAELRHSKSTSTTECLPFFIESSNITIQFDNDNPVNSKVSGSRSNSILRYQLEVCAEGNIQECLYQYVIENHSSPLIPYIVYQYLSNKTDFESLYALYTLIDGDATHTFHYRKLTQRLNSLKKLSVGSKLPSFTFIDQHGNKVLSDTLPDNVNYLALLVGASWCSQCDNAYSQLNTNFPDMKISTIDINRQPKMWDSPVINSLAVDHIPFIILLAPDGTIMSYDIRVWEVKTSSFEKTNN